MTEFNLFDEAFKNYEKNNTKIDTMIETKKCTHNDLHIDNGITYCINCGEQIENDNKDIRCEENDSFYMMDPNRCQIRKVEDRSIFKDVENMG